MGGKGAGRDSYIGLEGEREWNVGDIQVESGRVDKRL